MARFKYKDILTFVARRAGYDKWKFGECVYAHGYKVLIFESTSCFDCDEVKTISSLTQEFYSDDTACKVVKYLLSKKHNFIIAEGPHKCSDVNLHLSVPWIKLFKDNDTLESLAIEAELSLV